MVVVFIVGIPLNRIYYKYRYLKCHRNSNNPRATGNKLQDELKK
jgi:hypothetical protein